MSRLPSLKARELIAALKRAGFVVHHQVGSHVQLKHKSRSGKVTIPNHPGQDIKRSIVKSILDQAGLSEDDLLKLL